MLAPGVPKRLPMMAILTRPLVMPAVRLGGANEHLDESWLVLLFLLSVELPDESDVALDECTTGTSSTGSGSRHPFRDLVAVFGSSQSSGSSSKTPQGMPALPPSLPNLDQPFFSGGRPAVSFFHTNMTPPKVARFGWLHATYCYYQHESCLGVKRGHARARTHTCMHKKKRGGGAHGRIVRSSGFRPRFKKGPGRAAPRWCPS